VRLVPFDGAEIPILSCSVLAVFKAFFNRTRDWADIEAIQDAGCLDGPETLGWLATLLGAGDPRTVRLASLVRNRAS
jgi:hypothetical protein